jgi:hypothetical protein
VLRWAAGVAYLEDVAFLGLYRLGFVPFLVLYLCWRAFAGSGHGRRQMESLALESLLGDFNLQTTCHAAAVGLGFQSSPAVSST